ncbi:adenomatous polyposis coli protein isoform X2 [Anoplophora glabripennis]|nr:adenomatous polyposis coli protein isoform X2 [Anoplophora glabripennis]
MSVSSEPVSRRNRGMSSLYHGTWPVERTMWNSEPANMGAGASQPVQANISNQMEVTSVMSFASSSGGVPLDRVLGSSPERGGKWTSQQLEAKMDVVHSLLAMLGGQEHVDMGETLLALSTCPESCLAMRQSGCIPLLVQLVQSDRDGDTRTKASQALHNLVNSQPDEKLRKRESRILKLLDQCKGYTEAMRNNTEYEQSESSSMSEGLDGDKHPVQTVAHLMKLSFDEGHRQAICHLGGIHTIASLVEVEHTMHGSTTTENHCIVLRRYACMALTNLTFGDSGNKALLCSFREFMRALVIQLQSPSDELRQVTASVLRNLSWRADSTSKEILREVGSVTGLMKAAMLDNKENTLKSILSALWNLSAHCTENKSEICAVDGALGFLVDMLTYKTPSKSMAIIENSGGILRNISSQIAVREDYREVLRRHDCLQILLDQLKSPSLTIVSNACGTLWNLSAKCSADQEALWQMGAPTMLRSLNHSKHKMIAMGSSAALKNLISARPQQTFLPQMDSTALSLDLPALPTLGARKQKALMQDLDQSLSETYENIEKDSPVKRSDKDGAVGDFIQDPRHKTKTPTSPDYLQYELPPRSSSNLDEAHLSTAFASLNLNDPSTSYTSEFRSKSRIPQNFGSSSLPYMTPPIKRTNPCTYIPVRNKFSDCAYEDEIDVSDQPIDYSQKYSETKLPSNHAGNTSSGKDRDGFSYNKSKTEKESFSIYAETDLDQPTDYSLRYAEDDSDSDICNKITKDEPQEYVQDTVKTYCTEDTPYETPFNFSTATSMSDLRIDEKPVIDNDKLKESAPKTNKEVNKNADEKDHCSTEDISEIENRPKLEDKIPKSELSSGLMSPEKPVNYCEEGTPGYFSRVSSFGSLNSIPANETLKNETKENGSLERENQMQEKQVEKTPPKTPSEAKAVKFERVVNYAEETPLMFSRSSSLASLDSIEQHSIHDDRSSVVSDLSRLTSGIVSPSELPDSPTQTVPPSPKPRKGPIEFPTTSKPRLLADGRPQPAPRTALKPSVFEDNVTKFKEESTPIQFSTATSLSSLTIDDHEESNEASEAQPFKAKQPEHSTREGLEQKEEDAEVEKKDAEKETNVSDDTDEFNLESDDEGDEDLLAACISMGKQYTQQNPPKTQPPASLSKLPLSSNKYAQSNSSIPLSRGSSCSLPQPPTAVIPASRPSVDGVKIYDTEDAPDASKPESYTNADSKTSPKKDYLSDDSSNLSGDNERLLAECIRSGMPQPKAEQPKLSPKPVSYLPRRQIQTNIPFRYNPPGNTRRGSGEASKAPRADISRRENSLPPYLSSRDEVESYAVENSPYHYSLRSSLSDLTVEGSLARLKRPAQPSNQLQGASGYGQPSRSTAQQQTNLNISQEQNTSLKESSRRDSLSSISLESLGSPEAQQALLEQCISSGKPKSKSVTPPRSSNALVPRPVERRSMGKSHSRDRQPPPPPPDEEQKPKNVNAASVAGSTTVQANATCPEMPTAAAGVEENPEPEKGTGSPGPIQGAAGRSGIPTDTSRGKCSPSEGISSTGLTKSGSSESLSRILKEDSCDDITAAFAFSPTDNIKGSLTKSGSNKSLSRILKEEDYNNTAAAFVFSAADNIGIEDCLARSCEDSRAVDNRMLDPDAMIESLDRFTAELVSQASHLNKDEDKYKVSTGDNTWNEDTSPNEVTFPSISGSAPNVITFSNEEDSNKIEEDAVDGANESKEAPSNDFSSINTSTMTESTLIAIEASKMATVFKNEAEMSLSINSAASLELDHVQPPSHLNSLTNSAVGLEKGIPKSPKLTARKKSLSAGLMVRRALSNSLNHGSSLESLENQSLSNLDHVNPPSDLHDVFDLEGSMTSVASLPSENDIKTDFIVNGIVGKDVQNSQHPIFNVKQPFNVSNYSCELENINPPSLFNEITDFCNSLADFGSETICTETGDIFEDCYTHVAEMTLQEENITLADEVTEFSDAHSATPILSDLSSAESTPKKSKTLTKSMTTKQRRSLARDRYKTYTVAAEMVMREEGEKARENSESTEDSRTARQLQDRSVSDTTYVSSSYSVTSPKLTPREKRQLNRSRFETQVLDEAITSILQQPIIETPPPSDSQNQSCDSNSCGSSPAQSPARTKLSIRRNFMQKRLENKDRFRTQTLSESSFSPEISSASPPLINGDAELHLHLQKEADLVLRTLRDTKTTQDELLDCETLSLVSNDDDSEHNSGSSVNYRTYHKSWGFRKNIPIVNSENNNEDGLVNCQSNFSNDPEQLSDELTVTNVRDEYLNEDGGEERAEPKPAGKPKIVKPEEKPVEQAEEAVNEEQGRGIRGRRKPLYSKSNINNKVAPKNIKPAKTMASNLVKNVTSTLKSGTALKTVVVKQNKTTAVKPPVTQSRTSSGYGSKTLSNSSSPKTSPARVPLSKGSPKHVPAAAKQQAATPKGTPPMERQGTFTKDEPSPSNIPKPSSKIPTPSTTSKIPAFTSKIARSVAPTTSKIPNNSGKPPTSVRNGYVKSASSDRANKNTRIYNRSTSADSREPVRKMQPSPSSYSLKNEPRMVNGAVKKSGIPSPAQR